MIGTFNIDMFLISYLLIGFFIAISVIPLLKMTGQLEAFLYLFWKEEGVRVPFWAVILVVIISIMMYWPFYIVSWSR